MNDQQLAYFQSLRDGTALTCCPDEAKLRAFETLLAAVEQYRERYRELYEDYVLGWRELDPP